MKYLGIGLIWLGYAGALIGVAFGGGQIALPLVAFFGAVGATISSIVVACN